MPRERNPNEEIEVSELLPRKLVSVRSEVESIPPFSLSPVA